MPDRLPSLTGIRGIAALWVVLYHVVNLSWQFGLSPGFRGKGIAMSGWTGVDLFFLLSGFMLMHAHARQFSTLTWRSCRDFAVSRLLRVYPLHIAVLLAILSLILIDAPFAAWLRLRGPHAISAEAFFATLALANLWYPRSGEWNAPVWSLGAELVGYLFFPALAWLAVRLRSFAGCLALAAACIGAVLVEQSWTAGLGRNNIDLAGALIRMGGFFTAGILIRRAAEIRALPRGLPGLALLAVAAIVALLWVPKGSGLMPIPFAALIYALSDQRGPVSRVLSSRIALFLGAVSFPLYLLHTMPLMTYHLHVQRGDLPRWFYDPGLVVFLGVSLLASWLAHRWIEQPFHRLARRLVARWQALAAGPGAHPALNPWAAAGASDHRRAVRAADSPRA